MLTTRPAQESDKAFVLATWLRGELHASPVYQSCPRAIYFANRPQELRALLAHPNTRINIICLDDDQDVIIAYVVFSALGCLHWVYVKKAFRGRGIGKNALAGLLGALKAYSGITQDGRKLVEQFGLHYNPWGEEKNGQNTI